MIIRDLVVFVVFLVFGLVAIFFSFNVKFRWNQIQFLHIEERLVSVVITLGDTRIAERSTTLCVFSSSIN